MEYGLFLAKTVTIVLAVGAIVAIVAAASKKGLTAEGLSVSKLNDRYDQLRRTLRRAVLSKEDFKREEKERKAEAKEKKRDDAESDRPRVFVIDFKGDIRATAAANLREEVTAVLSTAEAGDEVVVRLENSGGTVHEHGLAASQLARLKDNGIPLTVVVDKVAASGGYMMACVADRIIAAPFAIVGSIGVLAQIPNFYGLLDRHGVEVEQLKAGRYKRTVTMFGRNTDEDREKLREELDDIHGLFQSMVQSYRPTLNLEEVATGEHWYGTRALELGLVDGIGTSDDLLSARREEADLYLVRWKGKKTPLQKLKSGVEDTAGRVADRFMQRLREGRFQA